MIKSNNLLEVLTLKQLSNVKQGGNVKRCINSTNIYKKGQYIKVLDSYELSPLTYIGKSLYLKGFIDVYVIDDY